VPPTGTLGELVRAAAESAERLKASRRDLERRASDASRPTLMLPALTSAEVAVIAEIKRASPSLGAIRSQIDAAGQARAYAEGGAAAISVLTEPSRFGGRLEDLESASAAVGKPVLRKDFLVCEEQILEARAAGASSVLLIARALEPALLQALTAFALAAGVEPLVEVRSEAELGRALDAGARLIGVNARDLETLEVERGIVPMILRLVPPDVIAVAESGIATRADVELVAAAGADAVLVGAALSRAADPRAATLALTGIPRRRREACS
jgi:indole-3-glycerol phosphate synthase